METWKEKTINFITNYISIVVAVLIGIIYIAIDLIVFNFNNEPRVVISKGIIYLFISTTIIILLRRQGMIYGNSNAEFILTKEKYNSEIDTCDTSLLDDFCDERNESRKVQLIKKKLKQVKLNYELFENGDYEIKSKNDKLRFSKRQLKAISYCNKLVVRIYDSDYLTKDIENEKNYKSKNISQDKYLKVKNLESIATGMITSLVFAYLTFSLAQDISWANVFYSLIKVITWLGSGVVSMVGAYMFVTNQYKEILNDKTNKIKEYKTWLNNRKGSN